MFQNARGPFAALTPEDFYILVRDEERAAAAMADDDADYRAMLAREVHGERTWRMYGVALRPCAYVNEELALGCTLREAIEAENGETLA